MEHEKQAIGILSGIVAITCMLVFMLPTYAIDSYSAKQSISSQSTSTLSLSDQKDLAATMKVISSKPVISDKKATSKTVIADGTSMGDYPRRKGVILVTKDAWKNLIPTGHAAIIYSSTKVVEALQQNVVEGNNNWKTSKNSCYGVSLNSTSAAQDSAAANWCHSQLGKPYNWNYFDIDTRSCFYCSQLVWASYKDLYNIDMNTSAFGTAIYPLELVSNSHVYIFYEHNV